MGFGRGDPSNPEKGVWGTAVAGPGTSPAESSAIPSASSQPARSPHYVAHRLWGPHQPRCRWLLTQFVSCEVTPTRGVLVLCTVKSLESVNNASENEHYEITSGVWYYVNMTNVVVNDGVISKIFVWCAKRRRNLCCLVDSVDLDAVGQVSGLWYANPARAPKGKYYVETKIWDAEAKTARTVMMHRLVMGVTDPLVKVDHRDNDGLNNRRENLRPCTHKQNHRFRQPDRDWAAYDARKTAADEYRREREIAKCIADDFGLTRQGLWMIRTELTLGSPAARAYGLRIEAAGVRSLAALQAAFPRESGGKFGIGRSSQLL